MLRPACAFMRARACAQIHVHMSHATHVRPCMTCADQEFHEEMVEQLNELMLDAQFAIRWAYACCSAPRPPPPPIGLRACLLLLLLPLLGATTLLHLAVQRGHPHHAAAAAGMPTALLHTTYLCLQLRHPVQRGHTHHDCGDPSGD